MIIIPPSTSAGFNSGKEFFIALSAILTGTITLCAVMLFLYYGVFAPDPPKGVLLETELVNKHTVDTNIYQRNCNSHYCWWEPKE